MFALIIALFATFAFCAIDLSAKFKVRLTCLVRLSGEDTVVVILDKAFVTALVFGVMSTFLRGVLGDVGAFLFGVDGGVAIYYT
jgi:hypothetical protein